MSILKKIISVVRSRARQAKWAEDKRIERERQKQCEKDKEAQREREPTISRNAVWY